MHRIFYSLFILSLTTVALQAQTNQANVSSLQIIPEASGLQLTTPDSSSLQLDIRTDAERIQFLMEVADVYFAKDEYEAAVNAYERILEIDPTHEQARYIVAHVYIEAKQYARAEEMLQKLLEDSPEDFKLMNNLAWLYATADDPKYRNGEKAIRMAQEAMVINPYDHHVWSTLSEGYYITGDYEKAYRAIRQMAGLAMRYGKNVTPEQVEEYNRQIRKCRLAWDVEKQVKGIKDEE